MFSYAWRGLWHYRRINLVVILAIAISTAVIGGSLIVGDSVRYSLRRMTELRLGQITHALHSPRFFRQQLASEILADEGWKPDPADVNASDALHDAVCAPAILLTGSVEREDDEKDLRRAGSVTLLSVDDEGWSLLANGGISVPTDRQIVLGHRTAQELQAGPGDEVTVWLEIPASIPRDSLLGERSETTVEIVLTVSDIIPEDVGASRFDLNPGQQLPYNAFLALNTMQERLGLEVVEFSPRNPIARPARVNTILVGFPVATDSGTSSEAQAQANHIATQVGDLNAVLQRTLTLVDLELNLRVVEDRAYLSAESERMILDDATADAVTDATKYLGLETAPTVVYLANEIWATDRTSPDERYSMYSIVAGLPLDEGSPFGPVRLADGSEVLSLDDDEILVSDWLASDLKVTAGETVSTKWHEVGSHGELPEVEKTFRIRGVLAADDDVTVDQSLTPVVEGVTDVEEFGDIRQPFEMDMNRLTDRDDEYWKQQRATPKAFVSLKTAESLWNSRYGTYTSIRINSGGVGGTNANEQRDSAIQRLSFEIPRRLDPRNIGMAFRPVRLEGLQAAVGANDFTQLFIGFSFFLILSAIILASLMFRLGIQKRINQMGLLSAVGFPERRVRTLFLTEGLLVCLCGAVAGAVAAVAFARLMIHGLTTWWIGAVGTQFLLLDVQPIRLVIAIVVSLILALIVIVMALRSFREIGVRDQLAGNAEAAEHATGRPGRWQKLRSLIGVGSIVTAFAVPCAVMFGLVPDGEAFGGLTWQMVCFFLAGFACLIAGLFLLSVMLQRRANRETIDQVESSVSGLAMANAARNPMRSLLTTALIAFATFVIVAVGAGRRNPLSETPDVNSGNGGFSLVAESAQPVLFDVNTPKGQEQLGFRESQQSVLSGSRVFPFSLRPGSDASCVNLYQTRIPTMLGASDDFLQRGGFRFADTPGQNPWELLNEEPAGDDQTNSNGELIPTIPVIGDMNTLMYSLKKGKGSTILFPDDDDPQFALKVVGMLDGSVFQGVLIMTDRNLKRIDASVAGARYFLIEAAEPAQPAAIATALETALNDFGFDTEPVSERLAGFLAVQNTYLSTFQLLGGLGLLVGTFGLAAVMMRNVVERRRELALMRAVGFTGFRISCLIVRENCVLLFWGILLGSGTALLAMLPHLRSTGADLPWQPLLLTLVAVAAIGSLASVFAVWNASTLSIRDNLAAE